VHRRHPDAVFFDKLRGRLPLQARFVQHRSGWQRLISYFFGNELRGYWIFHRALVDFCCGISQFAISLLQFAMDALLNWKSIGNGPYEAG
jgi:hypothetical protein